MKRRETARERKRESVFVREIERERNRTTEIVCHERERGGTRERGGA